MCVHNYKKWEKKGLMKYYKVFTISSFIYLICFLLDYIIVLFSINETSVRTTIFGLKIVTKMTPQYLNTTFSLTWYTLLTYIIFVFLCELFVFVFYREKIKK